MNTPAIDRTPSAAESRVTLRLTPATPSLRIDYTLGATGEGPHARVECSCGAKASKPIDSEIVNAIRHSLDERSINTIRHSLNERPIP